MRHRIFIAINLPEEVKKELSSFQEKLGHLFENNNVIRWTKKDNIHITLLFLGYITDQELLEVSKSIKEIVKNHKPLLVDINKVCYGPPKKMPPRMVWAQGQKSSELTSLKADFEKLISSENKAFSPHITLGRIKQWEWKSIEPEERPEIDEDISLSFEADSIEIMESKLKSGGPEYTILESVKLGEK